MGRFLLVIYVTKNNDFIKLLLGIIKCLIFAQNGCNYFCYKHFKYLHS